MIVSVRINTLSGGCSRQELAMQTRIALAVLLYAIGPSVAGASDFPGALKVSFQTRDCAGASGLGSVNVDHITRVQPIDCAGGRKLKQVLTRTPDGTNEVFTITEDEAVKLEAQIQRIMATRRKALEQTRPVIIQP